VVAVSYLALIVVAEAFVGSGHQDIGLTIHIVLLFALLFHGVFIWDRDRILALLLMAMSLAPLDRVLSLAVPHYNLSNLPWLALVSAPLLVAAVAVAYVEGMWVEELGLHLPRSRNAWFQGAVALTALPLGLIEFYILDRPLDWVSGSLTLVSVAGAALILFLATGLSEELIFRGIMLPRAVDSLGTAPGILFVSGVFASMHLFYGNPLDLVFVFAVGLFYAVVVVRSRSLWGVILSHTFANVVLYVIAPFYLR
jgi:membrane protease YdiL (CAAX protease family)